MAISTSNKILASDVTTALGAKIDTAGTGLSKSGTTLALATVVTAGNAGPTANATPAFGATFTVPYITYDAYGRVTGRTNRTVKIPAAPTSVSSATTATKATTVPNFAVAVANGYKCSGGSVSNKIWTLPSGGTWRYITLYSVGTSLGAGICGTKAGGSTLPLFEREGGANGNDYTYNHIAIRIS